MVSKTLCISCLCPDAAVLAIEIINRMGWAHDDPDEHGNILVNVPVEDEELFDFLDNCMC